MSEWYFRVRDYAKFSSREFKELIITAILFGFMLSFNLWGEGDSFFSVGIPNWILASILVFISSWWHIYIHKAFSLSEGYRTHYHWWFQGIIAGLILTFVSNGWLLFLFPGFTFYEHMKGLRLGKFRHGINKKDLVVPAVAGPFANVVMALVCSIFYVKFNSHWLLLLIKMNFLFAFMSLVPLPRLSGIRIGEGATSGLHIFFYDRPLYVFTLISILVYSVLIYLAATSWMSFWFLIISLVIGLIGLFVFKGVFDKT